MQESYATGGASGIRTYFQWVKERTNLEEQLINIAYQQLPKANRIGVAWSIQIEHLYSFKTYHVYIYSDPDGKRYYRLVRITGVY
jgi:hypothetical protein